MVLYHWKIISKISISEFYKINQSEKIKYYRDKTELFHLMIIKLINYHKKNHLLKFIEIAKHCVDLNDFTTAYILFSVLQEEEKIYGKVNTFESQSFKKMKQMEREGKRFQQNTSQRDIKEK